MRTLASVRLAIFLLLSASLAYAATTGTIRGTVTDPSGAVLAEARVTAVNEGTSETRTQVTDANGSFQFLLLPVGSYTLRVEKPNFRTYLLKDFKLTVNQVASFHPVLQLGSVQSEVTVQANPIQVDTTSTQVGTVIDSRPIVDLPLNGRNVYQLIALQPGITVPGFAESNNPAFGFTDRAPLVFSSGFLPRSSFR